MTRRVVVGHDTSEVRDALLAIVEDAGFIAVPAHDGTDALALLLESPAPLALVVDVAITGILAFELCDEIRDRGLPTKVIFVASVYSTTAYKRPPARLYGADDYVEQHQIESALPEKLARLFPGSMGPQRPSEKPLHQILRDATERRMSLPPGITSEDERLVHAQNIARLILADVLLYNGAEVENVATADEAETCLQAPFTEARSLLRARLGLTNESPQERDHLREALDEFFVSRKLAHGAASEARRAPAEGHEPNRAPLSRRGEG